MNASDKQAKALNDVLESLEKPDWGEIPNVSNAEVAAISARLQEAREEYLGS